MAEALAGADVLPPPPPPPPSQYWLPRHIKKRRRPSATPYRTVAVGAVPVGRSRPTIERISARLPSAPSHLNISTPAAVAIGPYHHGSPHLMAMEATKRAAADEFCRAVGQSSEQVCQNILPLAEIARSCYDQYEKDEKLISIDDGELAKMLFLDGCFLVQFMVFMCVQNNEQDPLMSRVEVHTRIYDIARDVLLLENQIPWAVLKALMDLWPAGEGELVTKFLDCMVSVFDTRSSTGTKPSSALLEPESSAPHHLLGLFHRRQVGKVGTPSLRIGILPSPGRTAVELAEMGIKLTASKNIIFGDMKMRKHRWTLGLFDELSLAPLVLNDMTVCWLLNMVAYEVGLGVTQADNFAVSSYVSFVALLANRREDVQELRAMGIINSAMSDEGTLAFFKWLVPYLRVGELYLDISRRIQQYKEKRWIWIAIHRFLYRYLKTMVAVVSAVGALAGFLKLIPSRS